MEDLFCLDCLILCPMSLLKSRRVDRYNQGLSSIETRLKCVSVFLKFAESLRGDGNQPFD